MRLLKLLIWGVALVCSADQSADGSNDTTWRELLGQAENLTQQGRYEEARRISGQALHAAEQIEQSERRVAATLIQFGLLHYFLGDYLQAEKAFLRGIRLLENCACESRHLSRLLDHLASLYLAADIHHAQGERLRRRAIDLCIAELGPEHPDVGILLSNLGATVMARGRFSEAETLFQRAVTLLEAHTDAYAANIAYVVTNRAVLLANMGRFPEAVADLTRGITFYEKALGPQHPELARPLINLARMYLELDRAALAEEPLRRAKSIAGAAFGIEHPVLAEVLLTEAVVLRKAGKKRESRETEKRAQAILARSPQRTANVTIHISDLFDSRSRSRK